MAGTMPQVLAARHLESHGDCGRVCLMAEFLWGSAVEKPATGPESRG